MALNHNISILIVGQKTVVNGHFHVKTIEIAEMCGNISNLYEDLLNDSKSWNGLVTFGTRRPESKEPLYVNHTTFPKSKAKKAIILNDSKSVARDEKLSFPRFAFSATMNTLLKLIL